MGPQTQQPIELKDIILDIAQLKRKKDELERELQSLSNEITKKEHFVYDSLQNEAIREAREARMKESLEK